MDSLLLTVRVVLSLGAVLVLLFWLQRRLGGGTPGRAGAVRIVARQGIGQKASVVVLDTGGRRFTLGVTEQNITVLDNTDAPEPEIPDPAAPEADTSAGTKWNEAVSGSILAPDTWRNAAKAIKGASKK